MSTTEQIAVKTELNVAKTELETMLLNYIYFPQKSEVCLSTPLYY